MPDKDEILRLIQEAKEKQELLRGEWQQVKEDVKSKDKARTDLKFAYEEVRRQFERAEKAFAARRDDLKSVESQGRAVEGKIESLQRELARLIDSERINAEYQQMVRDLQEASRSASWRKENRDDDFGAYEHQIDGAIHLAAAKRAFLGDKRGLGKSLTSLIWADLLKAKKVIVISPADTMDNYVREIVRWTPHRAPIKLGRMPKPQRDFLLKSLKRSPTFTIIINFEAWRRDTDLIPALIDLQADTVIVDEAHYAKESDTLVAKGISELMLTPNMCPACGICLVRLDGFYEGICACGYRGLITDFSTIKNYLPMSGTPILNKPQELYPHLHIIAPNIFPSERVYLLDFAVKGKNQRWYWKDGAEDRLMKKIGSRYLARDRKTAGIILPPNAEVEHIITMEDMQTAYPAQFKAYKEALTFAQIALDPDGKHAMSMAYFINVLMRLRQVLVWPNAISLDIKDEDGNFIYTQKLDVYESIKLDKAEELIKEMVEEGERVVLFSQFKPGLHELQNRLGDRAIVYDGSASSYTKNQIQLDFDATIDNPNPRWDVVLGVYKSGGTGLNLTGASQGILLDSEWSPGREDQAVGRWDRIGQTRDTTTNYIIIDDMPGVWSVDRWMQQLIQEKRNMTEGFESTAELYQKTYDALRNMEK